MAQCGHAKDGARLRGCTELALATEGRSVHDIFGAPDNLKFHSCMTLFARAAPEEPVFRAALAHCFAGPEDAPTLQRLAAPLKEN